MARFSNAAEWDPGVTEATEADPGPPTLGSTYRLMVRAFGRSLPLDYRICEFDRPHRVVLSAANSMVRSTDVIQVSAGPEGGSTLTYDATLGFGWPSRPFHAPARPLVPPHRGPGHRRPTRRTGGHDRGRPHRPVRSWPGPPTPWPRPRWLRVSAGSASGSAAGWRSGTTRPQ